MVEPREQLAIFCKGVETIISKEELLKKLEHSYEEKRPLVIKLGLDPSAPDIHLGHTVVLRKVRQMQELGHKAIIIIGDFTGKIGDPTGKSKTRKPLTREQVKNNAMTYCEQIFKVIDKEKTEVRFNSEWLSKLTFEEIIQLSSITTVARMLEREDFHNRYQRQQSIGLHEFFYPLMQAYDSVRVKADIELGGTDQTFNILMGRSLQKSVGQEQQTAMFLPILPGLDGVEKMSKSLGNYIGINEPASVMFKKVMEVPDALIIPYFELVTDEHPDVIKRWSDDLENGRNPKEVKLILADIITRLYHSEKEANEAREYFDLAFGKKRIPNQIPELLLEIDNDTIYGVIPQLISEGYIKSKSEFIRLVKENGVQIEGEKLQYDDMQRVLLCGDVMKIGKKRFVKFIK